MSRVNYSKKRAKGVHLQYEDRHQIERYIKENHLLPKKKKRSMRRIASLLGISPATMSRELKRGRVDLLSYDLRPYVVSPEHRTNPVNTTTYGVFMA